MTAITLTITTAGRAALINAAHDGTNAVRIAAAGLTATVFTANAAAVTVPGEFARIPGVGGSTVDPDTISLVIRDDSNAVYTLRGFGLFLADGTLFALYGQPTAILEKSTNSTALIAVDVRFADIDAATLTFGNANFLNPPATTTVQGVIEIATPAEAIAGTDAVRAVAPSGLKAAIDARFGNAAPTTLAKSLLGAVTAAAMRVLLEIKSAALKDEGPGNGLNADLLDGYHAAAGPAGPAWGTVPVVGSTGVIDIGTAIDFHAASAEAGDYAGRLALSGINLSWNGARVWTIDNDGSGSGMDADTVDGIHGTAFLRKDVAGQWTLASSTVNGLAERAALVLREANFAGTAALTPAAAPRLAFYWNQSQASQIGITPLGEFVLYDGASTGYTSLILSSLSATGTISVAGNIAWHAGNDGSGSGLDADLLDGQHGSYYANVPARLGYEPYNASNPAGYIAGISGSMVITALGYTPWHAGNDGSGSGLDADLLDGQQGSYYADIVGRLGYAPYRATNPAGYISGINDVMVRSALGYTPWHAGNDGSGSGLDADLLDGKDSGAFAQLANMALDLGANCSFVIPGTSGNLLIQIGSYTGTIIGEVTVNVALPIAIATLRGAFFQGRNNGASNDRNSHLQFVSNTSNNVVVKAQSPQSEPAYVDGFFWCIIATPA